MFGKAAKVLGKAHEKLHGNQEQQQQQQPQQQSTGYQPKTIVGKVAMAVHGKLTGNSAPSAAHSVAKKSVGLTTAARLTLTLPAGTDAGAAQLMLVDTANGNPICSATVPHAACTYATVPADESGATAQTIEIKPTFGATKATIRVVSNQGTDVVSTAAVVSFKPVRGQYHELTIVDGAAKVAGGGAGCHVWDVANWVGKLVPTNTFAANSNAVPPPTPAQPVSHASANNTATTGFGIDTDDADDDTAEGLDPLPRPSIGQLMISLEWSETPKDLDLWLIDERTQFPICGPNMTKSEDGAASYIQDATRGLGPEGILIDAKKFGKHASIVRVVNVSNGENSWFGGSKAVVKVKDFTGKVLCEAEPFHDTRCNIWDAIKFDGSDWSKLNFTKQLALTGKNWLVIPGQGEQPKNDGSHRPVCHPGGVIVGSGISHTTGHSITNATGNSTTTSHTRPDGTQVTTTSSSSSSVTTSESNTVTFGGGLFRK